jgi:hypothetical protein
MTDSSAPDLPKFMTRLANMVKKPQGAFFAMRREILSALDEQSFTRVSSGGGVKYEVVDGKPIVNWRGFPIVVVDGIKIDEARIT